MKLRKQGIGLLLVLCMILSLLPVGALAAEAEPSLAATGTDTSMGGLITQNESNIQVTWSLEKAATGEQWKLSEQVQGSNGCPVLALTRTLSNSLPSRAKLTVDKPCYLVYDYVLVDDAGGAARFYAGATTSSASTAPSTSYTGVPEERVNCTMEDLANHWKTAVVDCTNTSYPAAAFQYNPKNTTTSNGINGLYISNIRIYDTFDKLPENCKVHLKFEFNSEHGNLKAKIPTNGQSAAEDQITANTEKVIPLNSQLYSCTFTSATGVSFTGFSVEKPNGQKEDLGSISKMPLCEPGTYTITVKTNKMADKPDSISVQTNTGDSGAWMDAAKKDNAPDGYWLYSQKYGENTTWKISFSKGEKQYDSVEVTDNGQTVNGTGDNGDFSYELTPGNEAHDIRISFKQSSADDSVQNIFIWPTLDYEQAFGKYDGMTDDFWNQNQGNALTLKLEKHPNKYNFMYEADPGAGKDNAHEKIFTSAGTPASNKAQNTFTFSKQGIFSFDYLVYANSDDASYSFKVFNNGGDPSTPVEQTSGIIGWQHVQVPIGAGSNKFVAITFDNKGDTGVWAAIANVSFLSEQKLLTIQTDGGGTVSGASSGSQYYLGQQLTLKATPTGDNVFIGWYKNDELLSTDATFVLNFMEEQTIKAKFQSRGNNIAQVGTELFETLEAAFAKAQQVEGDTVVRLLVDYSLPNDFTVPTGETLLVPCSAEDVGYDPVTGFNPDQTVLRTPYQGVDTQAKEYVTLTIPADKTLTVNGTVLVNAVTGRPHAGHYDQDVTGGYAEISLSGNIVVNSGGVLDVCGYLKGDGTVTAHPGGEVRDLYVVRHWRGGTQASSVFFQDTYPMNEVDMHNIQSKTVIEAGARLMGTVKMYATGSYYYTRFPQMDAENGLIRMASGKLTKTYDAQNKREKLVLDGVGEISYSALPIVGLTMSTGDYVFPIDGDDDFELSGTWAVSERLKIMPGGTVTLKDGATVTITQKDRKNNADNMVVFYDKLVEDFSGTAINGTHYPQDRGAAKLILGNNTTLNVNGALAGTVEIAASETTPAKLVFGQDSAVTATTTEAKNKVYNSGVEEHHFTLTVGGYTPEKGAAEYSCWVGSGTTMIEIAGNDTTQEKVYNGAETTWDGAAADTTVEYKNGDAWSTAKPKNHGSYTVREVVDGETYKVVKALGTLTINQLPVQITWTDPDSLVYDGSEKTVTAAVGNKAGDDDVTVTVDKPSGTTVGEYTSTVTALGGAAADNYTLDGGENLTHTWNISAAQRTEKPTVSADTPTGIKDKVSITVTGIDGVTVEYSTAEDGTYTDLAGTTLEAEQDTTYYFRYKADANYTAGPAESVKTGKFDAPAEATPDISIDYGTEQLTGFGEGKYTVNGNEVTAQDGKAAISEDWFGKTLEIVKKGDEETTFDSAAQSLEIPARPEAPTATPNKETRSGGGGSVKVEVEDGKAYEYKKDDGAEWADVPTGGEIKDLSAGKYEVRVKATENSFAGIARVAEVEKYTPQSSGGSPGGSPGSSTPPADKTETVTNPDGSTTTTTTKSDGSKTETTKQTDGTVSEKVTKKDGSTTETTTTPSGMTGKVETDANGDVKSAEAVVPAKAETDERGVVTLPIEVPALTDAKEAPEISVSVKGSDPARVECPVTEFGPGTVAVLVHEDGTEEVVRDCVMGENGVILNVEGDVTLKIVDNTRTFSDVEPVDHWATDAVEFVAARELFNGTGDGKFTPGGDMTRGMLVTVLYRLNYEPEAVSGGFADIDANAYYADAVAWAQDAGVVSGYGNGQFGPNDDVTREQIVTILYRYAEKNGYLAGHTGTLAGYADAGKVSGYAMEAMSWAVNTGLVRGVDDTHLAPTNNATRAEVATILMRFCEQMMG